MTWEPTDEMVERELAEWRNVAHNSSAFRGPSAYVAARHVLRERHESMVRTAHAGLRDGMDHVDPNWTVGMSDDEITEMARQIVAGLEAEDGRL